jgi:NADH-quinone oxidoreductase subunit M
MLIAVATTGVIFAAVYLLYMVYRTFFGPVTDERNATMKDLNLREIGLLMPLMILMIWMGFGPTPFLEKSEGSVRSLLETIEAKRQAGIANAEGGAWQVPTPAAQPVVPASRRSLTTEVE